MIALVTGAAGFLGSHLVDALLGREYRVIGLDDLSTGSLENLTDAWATGHFIFRACDVSAAIDVANGVDVVFHFASPAGRYDCERLALETLRVNGRGTDLCCQLALRNGARLVYASIPPETNASCEASSVYGEAKRYGESIVGAYARGSGLDARIVRMYDVYGPRLRLSRGGAVSIFIGQALREAAFTIDGDDTQSVALSYVDDVVDAVVRYAEVDAPSRDVVSVGSEREIGVLRVAQIVADIARVPCRVQRLADASDEIRHRRADCSSLREMLGDLHETPLERGLARTFEWHRATLDSDGTRCEQSAGLVRGGP